MLKADSINSNRFKLNHSHKEEVKCISENKSETIYQPLEAILKQMLRVWGKENMAIRNTNISGKKSGNNNLKTKQKVKQKRNNIIVQRYLCAEFIAQTILNINSAFCRFCS